MISPPASAGDPDVSVTFVLPSTPSAVVTALMDKAPPETVVALLKFALTITAEPPELAPLLTALIVKLFPALNAPLI